MPDRSHFALPQPAHGARSAAANRCDISARTITRVLNGERRATLGEAIAFNSTPELGLLGRDGEGDAARRRPLTIAEWTGVQLPAGTALGGGLYALPGRPDADGFIVPETDPTHPMQMTLDDAIGADR